MDETYLKLRGNNVYLYRAINNNGFTTDFMVSETRDEAAALEFFNKDLGKNDTPEVINIDGSTANDAAIISLNYYLYIAGLWPIFG